MNFSPIRLTVFLISAAVLVGCGLGYYLLEVKRLKGEAAHALSAIGALKADQIAQWRGERLGDANRTASSPFFREAVAEWLVEGRDSELEAKLRERLTLDRTTYDYENVLIADARGDVLLATTDGSDAGGPVTLAAIRDAIDARSSVLSPLYDAGDDATYLDSVAPIYGTDGDFLAVLVLRCDAERFLFPLVESWPTPSASAESFIFRREGEEVLFLNRLRHGSQTAFSARFPLSRESLPAVQAALGRTGIYEGDDYRDARVLADLRAIPNSPWYLVCKVDEQELLYEARFRAAAIGLLVLALLAALATLLGYLSRARQARLYTELYESEQAKRRAEAAYRTTLYSIGDAVITTNPAGRVRTMNPAASKLTGWTEAEARDQPIEAVFCVLDPETEAPATSPVTQVIQHGEASHNGNGYLLVARDGSRRPVADSVAPVRDQDGHLEGAVLVFRDRSEEVRKEETLRGRTEMAEFQAAVATALAGAVELRTVLQQVAQILVDTFDAAFARVWILEENEEVLELVASAGTYTHLDGGHSRIALGAYKIGRIAASGKAHLTNEVVGDPEISDQAWARNAGIKAFAGYPLVVAGRVVGVMGLFSRHALDTGDFQAMNTVARNVASAIQRKRAEEGLRESTALLRIAGRMARMGGWRADLRTNRVAWSDEVCAIHEVPAGTQPDLDAGINYYAPEWRETIRESFAACAEEGLPFDLELELITAKNNRIWVRAIGEAVRSESGEIVSVQGAFQDISEQRAAEAEVRRLADRLQNTFESITDALFTLDRNWRFTYVNREAERLLERPREELIGTVVWEEFPEAVDSQFQQAYEHAMAYNVTVDFEEYFSPLERWFDVRAYPSAEGLAVYFRDVTERKEALEELRRHEAMLARTESIAEVGSWEWDAQTDRVTWSEGMFRIFGRDPADGAPSSRDIELLLPAADFARLQEHGSRCALKGEPFEIELRVLRKSGEMRSCLARGFPEMGRDGAAKRVFGSFLDITDRKRTEEELRSASRLLAKTFESLSEAVIVVDPAKRTIVQCNPAVECVFGYRPEELIDQNTALLHVDQEHYNRFAEDSEPVLSRGAVFRTEFPMRRKDDTIIDTEISVSALHEEDGWEGGVVSVVRDISERKAAEEERKHLEEQLQQAQKMEAVGRLAGGIAHDFNNMLGVILGHAELALTNIDAAHPLLVDLEEIQSAARRSADLTRQLLAFARRQTITPDILDLNEAVDGMLTMLKRLLGEDIALHWKPAEDVWPVKIDPVQLQQVLANLTVNARDAIAGHGQIWISTANVTVEAADVEAHPDVKPGDYTLLTVRDDGCGMDEATLAHLFEPFFTTKPAGQGTGLGLAMVYGSVKQNSGFVEVDSTPGAGSTFRIYYPRFGKSRSRTQTQRSADAPGGTETILLVEDEAALLRLAKRYLDSLGYTALCACSPTEALAIAGDYDGDIHLVMTDVVMPEMNGRELVERVRRLRPGLKSLYMSGYTADVIASRGVLEEGVQFVQKPFTREQVAEKIRAVLAED